MGPSLTGSSHRAQLAAGVPMPVAKSSSRRASCSAVGVHRCPLPFVPSLLYTGPLPCVTDMGACSVTPSELAMAATDALRPAPGLSSSAVCCVRMRCCCARVLNAAI